MRKSTLIVQITDCHLPADPQQEYRGVNPHRNLQAVLARAMAMNPDVVLATGDLSEDGSLASYLALKQLFDPFGVPLLVLPGNHDDAGLLAQVFAGSPVESISISEHGAWQIIRLNSCLVGKPEGRLGEQSLTELERLLGDGMSRPRLIAIHHQPLAIGSPWIDKYRLLDPDQFLRLVDQHQDVKAVVCGHVHQVFESSRKGCAMLAGPSSAINSLSGAQKFTPDPAGPAFRWLELSTDGDLKTGICRVY